MIELIPELEPARSVVERWLRPTIWISLGAPETGTVGQSRLGATPDLPPSLAWPSRSMPGGGIRHLDYLLQINLAELPEEAAGQLPDSGMVWLFEEWNTPDDRDQFVVYTGDEPLFPTDPPGDSQNYVGHVTPHRLEFRAGHDLPTWASDADDEFRVQMGRALYPDELDLNDDLLDEIDTLVREQRRKLADGAFARLFGYASGIGHSVHEDAAAHRIDPAAFYDWPKRHEMDLSDSVRWRNLLTVESKLEIGLVIGDAGYTVVLIHEDDLAAGDFSQVYISNESS